MNWVGLTALFTLTVSITLYGFWIHFGLGGFPAGQPPSYELIHFICGVLAIIGFFYPLSILFQLQLPMKRQIVKYIHASFATLSFGLMITGITFAWKSNEEYGGVHFYTAHSWLGLTLVSMMGLQWIFGVIGFLFQAVNPDIRKTLMVAHKFVGNTMLLMSIAVFVSGTAEKIAFGDANHSNLAAAGALFGAFTSILCSLVLYLYKLPADSTNPNAEKTPLLGAPALSVQTNH